MVGIEVGWLGYVSDVANLEYYFLTNLFLTFTFTITDGECDSNESISIF